MKNIVEPTESKGLIRRVSGVAASVVLSSLVVNGAHAQSSVTLYGVLSTTLEYVSNSKGNHLFALSNGGMMPPRWGLRGVEDLGGGTQAIFTLENGFNITNGAMLGGTFGRQAYVGLSNRGYGTITLGRQYEEMTNTMWFATSSNVFAGYGAHIGDNDNMFFTNRFNNAVRYASPAFAGLSFAGSFAFSNSTQFSNNDGYSGSVSYVHGPLKVAAAFTQFNRRSAANPSNVTSGAVDSTGWGFSSPFVTSPGGAGADQQRIMGVGGTYDFGIFSVLGNYTNVLFNYADSTGLRLQNVEGAIYKFIRPDWEMGAAYVYTHGDYSVGRSTHYNQFDIASHYFLSKRTDLFLIGIYQRASGPNAFAQIYTTSPSSSKSQTLVEAGIMHKF
ncbi:MULTISPECIES: porin [unclassified Caballeronia]|uniref:porin n=1 Tax=unclassified Caballeronia TaxID=2646786 RepID=UPI0028651348|nr:MULTISPECIES: porin [unclassified Caballeronia]MDR5752480.1 porin [Caballeronia sp. LZ024]MDR5845286.1 porin [Caballeronia sp. LZ031]